MWGERDNTDGNMVYSLYLFSGALPFTWNFHHVFHSLETSFPFTWNLYHVFKWSLMCHGYLPKPYEFKQDSKFAEWSFYSSCTFKDCVNSLVQWTLGSQFQCPWLFTRIFSQVYIYFIYHFLGIFSLIP